MTTNHLSHHQDVEYKNITFNLVKHSFKQDDNNFYFEGYGSTFGNEDLGGDVVIKGAFTNSLKLNGNPQMFYMHNPYDPCGVWLDAKEDNIGLYLKGVMPLGNTNCKNIAELMRIGAIKSLSIGYRVMDYEMNDGKRLLKEIDLIEVSPVSIPMNPKAIITSVKMITGSKSLPLADKDTKWDSDAAEGRVRKYADATDAPNDKYAKAFMYCDDSNKDNFTSYKLPFADIIDGELKAVPGALFAIAAVLNGGRGGVNIPDADKSKIKTIVDKYYKKMNMDSPFKSYDASYELKDICDFDCMKDFEEFLKNPSPLSKTERKVFISKLKEFSGLRDVGNNSSKDENDVKTKSLLENEGRDVAAFSAKIDEILSIIQKKGNVNDTRTHSSGT